MSAVPAFADPSSISAKEAEVQSVLNQIDQLDGSLERAIEAYNLATDKLHAIEGDLQTNLRELHIAKANLGRSQKALSKRLVSIYTSGDDTSSTLGILLGAGTIDDMLSQIETVNRVSNQDLRINRQIIEFKGAVKQHRIELRNAEAEAQSLVQERSDQKASIQSQLSERHQLVASIRSDIERMKQEEAQRQAELARQARERAAEAANAPAPIVSTSSTAAPPATTPSPVAPPSSGGGNGTLVSIAMQYLGIPYVWGGASPGGFDCSGLVMYVYAQVGVSLPHNAAMQFGYGMPVSRDQLAARRPRLLLRPRPRRDLHRRRPVHPRAAHRRRGQDLEPGRRLGTSSALRRRPPRSSDLGRVERSRSRRRSAPRRRGASASASA